MTVAVGEAPLQFLLRQCVKVELILVIDAATDDLDDFLRKLCFWLTINHFHSEALLDAGEVEILSVQTPPAGTDIVEHVRHFLAILKGGDIDLLGGVEGGAVGVEVHRAGLVHVEVRAVEVIVKGVLVGVVPWHLGGRGVLRRAAGNRDNQEGRNHKTHCKQMF